MLSKIAANTVGAGNAPATSISRRLAPQSVMSSLLDKVTKKAKGMQKHEQIAYEGAFLAQARTSLLPYLQHATRQSDLDLLPDEEAEGSLLQQVYEDVNELYTDEHLIMTQADLLEQMYRT